jgi:hypothetical protein
VPLEGVDARTTKRLLTIVLSLAFDNMIDDTS